ncbi:MAG: NADAR domain-containing protein [Oscillospiraceae bacterium]
MGFRRRFFPVFYWCLVLDTDDDILAECAVQDLIWGTGISMTDPARYDINAWRGQNLLGYSLMLVREDLKKRS